jgi:hypothetical protein
MYDKKIIKPFSTKGDRTWPSRNLLVLLLQHAARYMVKSDDIDTIQPICCLEV